MRRGAALLLIGIVVLLASCSREAVDTSTSSTAAEAISSSSTRDTGSTPAERLVGHWTSDVRDDVYFGERNAEGIGNYIIGQILGPPGRHTYTVVSQDPEGERVTTLLHFSDGGQREQVYMVSNDGTELTSTTTIWGFEITTNLTYVDDQTEPQS